MDILLQQNENFPNRPSDEEKNTASRDEEGKNRSHWLLNGGKWRRQFFESRAAQVMIEGIDHLEKVPVIISSIESNKECIEWLKLADEYLKQITIKEEIHIKLLQRIIALRYRLERLSPDEFNLEVFNKLRSLALEWKKAHPLVNQAILTARELNHLKKTAHYPEILEILTRSNSIREVFFNWVLRDENEVGPFIEFPATAEKIFISQLSGRISRNGETALKIEKERSDKGDRKILTLPFEGCRQNILNPKEEITFRGNYHLKMDEIFQIFAQKEVTVGNLEFMRDGIVNWNIHHLGYWDADKNDYVQIDMEVKEWWKQMPSFEVLTHKQAVKRYKLELKSREWVVAEVATRGNPDLDFIDTHAYLEVAIPMGNGHYAIYDFGKLSFEYPANMWDKLRMLTKTVHATVAYPDENVFYTHRQNGFHPFRMTFQQGMALMQRIKKDILISRQRNFIYQIQSENCAKWVHMHLVAVLGKETVPDFFRMQLLDTHPKGILAHLFQWIKKLPENWQVPVFTFLHLPLGASRKIWIEEKGQIVSRSLSTHSFFETGEVFLPALLIAKISQVHGLISAKKILGYGRHWIQLILRQIEPKLSLFRLPELFFILANTLALWVKLHASDLAQRESYVQTIPINNISK